MIKLRQYQITIIDGIKKALKITKQILVVAVTRSGKTIIFGYMCKKWSDAGKNVLILVHRKELLEQTAEKLALFGISAGVISSDRPITKNKVQIGMIKTVHNIIKKQIEIDRDFKEIKKYEFSLIKKPDVIIGDENHRAAAKTWLEVFAYFDDVPRIGFTATPQRLDGKPLNDIFSIIVQGESTQWMVDNYYLSKPIHLCPKSPLTCAKLKTRMGDYDTNQQTDLMDNEIVAGEVVANYRKFFNGAFVIVFCSSVKSCEYYKKEYEKDGWKAEIIEGKMNKTKRKKILEIFKNGEINVLLNVNILTEGVDAPGCAGVQMLRKTKSLMLYLQALARGLTPMYADCYDLEIKEQRKILQKKENGHLNLKKKRKLKNLMKLKY
jgi:DNA repair protein RadD